MTTIEISARRQQAVETARLRLNPLSFIGNVWATLARKVEERQIIHRLYQLDAHVLRDMGFDPEAVYRAREGAIGDLGSLRTDRF